MPGEVARWRARRSWTLALALLAGTALVSLVALRMRDLGRQGRRMHAVADMQSMYNAAVALQEVRGRFPASVEELLHACFDESPAAAMICVFYPRDPWGHDYHYEIVKDRPRVTCYGSDGAPGGTDGEAVDLVYPEPGTRGERA